LSPIADDRQEFLWVQQLLATGLSQDFQSISKKK
jgi:hypothetical protein